MVTVYFYVHILFTGSVGRIILLVVPVDTLYRNHLLDCPASEPFRKSIFGFSLILSYGPEPWGVARLLGLRGVPPRPHPSEGVG